jgi:hypothetical protein
LTFALHAWRFCFVADDSVYFPAGKAGNVLRGAFGTVLQQISGAYARIFEPSAVGGPSGLSDPPRPFVFRAAHLNGRTVDPGEPFSFDLHVFEVREQVLPDFARAFSEAARQGFGPGRGRANLTKIWQLDSYRKPARELSEGDATSEPIVVPLSPDPSRVDRVTVRFMTPTALKWGPSLADKPEFQILFARTRDRVSTLRALYGEGPLDIDFAGMSERAARVKMTRCDLRQVDLQRRSSRTGQVHPLGGFVGEADYEGDLAEFTPFLRAAQWTGVGRHTVWGKGELLVLPLSRDDVANETT